MTVYDIETGEPTDRGVTFAEATITDLVNYCDALSYPVVILMINEDGERLSWIGDCAYNDPMIGMLAVAEGQINRELARGDPADDEPSSDEDVSDS